MGEKLSHVCYFVFVALFIAVGNRRFRLCVANNLSQFLAARTKNAKSTVVTEVVKAIKENSKNDPSGGGGFVRKVRRQPT